MKSPKILFPCNPSNPKEVDYEFKSEYSIANTLGIESFFYDHDLLAAEDKIKLYGLKDEVSIVILRGWMLTPSQYEKLFNSLAKKNYHLYTNPVAYIQLHYLKNSYKYIESYTAKTLFSDKFDKETLGEMFDQFENGIVLKDYVKSEKHIPGLFIIPKETTHEQLEDVVKRFIEARGKLFNEGVAFRDFIDLKKYDGEVNEWRTFIFKDKIVALEQNSNINTNTNNLSSPSREWVLYVSRRLSLLSTFYTIDLAEKADGSWMVVETGDGQVSGLAPHQSPLGLYNAFLTPIEFKRHTIL